MPTRNNANRATSTRHWPLRGPYWVALCHFGCSSRTELGHIDDLRFRTALANLSELASSARPLALWSFGSPATRIAFWRGTGATRTPFSASQLLFDVTIPVDTAALLKAVMQHA